MRDSKRRNEKVGETKTHKTHPNNKHPSALTDTALISHIILILFLKYNQIYKN